MDFNYSETVKNIADVASNMYRLGWDERNGGNISVLVTEDEVKSYFGEITEKRRLALPLSFPELGGKYFVVTGTGKYFRNIEKDPEENLGLIKISDDGTYASLIWGYRSGGTFTSEIAMHLGAHIKTLEKGNETSVVMHSHPTNTVAMTHIHDLDEKAFTLTLWNMITECIVIFPEGVAVLPWMVSSGNDIGIASGEKFKDFRILIWALHGVTATGSTLEETFGLIETVEKAAEIYMKICAMPKRKGIDRKMLRDVADAFHLKVREGWL